MNTDRTGLSAVIDFFVNILLLLAFPIGLVWREVIAFFRDDVA